MKIYKNIEKLGQGATGIVYKAVNKETGEVVALKRIKLANLNDGIPTTALREISSLRELKHPNIVKLYDVILTKDKLTLIFEYHETDLGRYISKNAGHISESMVKGLMRQLLKGLAFCHENHLLHRDLKPQNLLLSKRGELKLADFGLAKAYNGRGNEFAKNVVTLWYRSPDVLLGSKQYETSIDMWSIGCIFAEIVNGTVLFKGSNECTQLKEIFSILGSPGKTDLLDYHDFTRTIEISPPKPWSQIVPTLCDEGIDLLSLLLKYDPSQRISAEDALSHPYFHDFDDSVDMCQNIYI